MVVRFWVIFVKQKELKRYQVKAVRDFLFNAGIEL
ncbi:hypothetical protein GLO73106DRAFT_00024630 [Gloeocapsa sp. PCC 73106]|nr:hypothetical protein GLO73106DRAFT_00024630 [Gloeocapsa sp. PCC 73106]